MHKEVVTYPDPNMTSEETTKIHGEKLAKWLEENPPPLKRLLNALEEKKRILIIGYPGGGKSPLFNKLVDTGDFSDFFMAQSDDYKEYGFVKSLYVLMDDLEDEEKYLVEGILGYRLLRKIAQRNLTDMKPDIIIKCTRNRPPLDKHKRMRKALDTTWRGYVEIEKELPPVITYTSDIIDGEKNETM